MAPGAREVVATLNALSPSSPARIDDGELSCLLERLVEAAPGPLREDLMTQVITLTMPVAQSIAHRYRNRGVSDEDLEQIAYLGLTKAVQRWDASRAGDHFLSYAVPTIRGEVRRYFRDHGWTVRPTRALQEVQPQVIQAREELHAGLGRSPRPSEIAAHLGEPEDVIVEALTLDGCYRPTSLDIGVGADDETTLGSLLPSEDRGWGAVEARVVLAEAMRDLGERDRRILFLRFFEEHTQSQIAEELGITQMQVSRLLARILRNLRDRVGQVPSAG